MQAGSILPVCPPLFRRLLKILFWFQFIVTGFYGSFMPYTMTGLVYHMTGLLLLVLWILQGFLYREPWLRAVGSPTAALLIVLNFFHALTIFKANTPSYSRDFVEGRFWVLLLLLVACDLMADSDFRGTLRKAWFFVAFATACYGIYQVHVGLPDLRNQILPSGQPVALSLIQERFLTRLNSSEMFGTYVYPNIFGAFCAMAILSFPGFRPRRSGAASFLFLASFGVLLYAVCCSQAKGAVLALVISVLVTGLVFLWSKGRRRTCLAIVVAALILGTASARTVLSVCGPSIEVRLGYWESALSMIREKPLGVGIANFGEHYSAYMTENATEVKMAHNDHLQQLAELGVVGFLLYAAFYLCLLRSAFLCLVGPGNEGGDEEGDGDRFPVFGWAATAALAILFLMCQIGRMGPMDVDRMGGLLWMTLLAAVIVISTAPRIGSGGPLARAVPLAMVVYFISHSSVDFLFYDHSLTALFAVTVLGLIGENAKDMQLPRGSRLVIIVVMVGTVYLLFDRYLTIFPVSKYEAGHPLAEKDLGELVGICRSVPRELTPWETLLTSLERNPQLMRSPEAMACYREALDGALACRPHSSALCLKKARVTAAPSDAEHWYIQAIREYPRHPRYCFYYAIFLSGSARYVEAREYFEKALRLHQEASARAKTQPDFKLLCLKEKELDILRRHTRFMVL